MLALLFCWILFFILCVAVGSLFVTQKNRLFLTFILGVAVLALTLQIWVVFLPIKLFWIVIALLFAITLSIKWLRQNYFKRLKDFINALNPFTFSLLVVLLFIASLPFILNDDATYYQQTIKWMSQYGYVPGLANLKIHFGLASSWHLLSALFYFEELPITRYYNFNGLVLFVLIFTTIGKVNQAFSLTVSTALLIIGSLFIISPSPDLVIMVCTFYIFFNIKKINPIQLAWIVGFLITVKLSAAGLLLFFLPIFSQLEEKKTVIKVLPILLAFAVVLIIRNVILTGYPFFPALFVLGTGFYQVPDVQIDVLYDVLDGFIYTENLNYNVKNLWDRFLLLFQVRPYKIILNAFCVLSILGIPILLLIRKSNKDALLALAIFINGLLWFLNAPNYRFIIAYPVILFTLSLDMLPSLVHRLYNLKSIITIISMLIILIIPFKIGSFMYTVNCGKTQQINASLLVKPADFNQIRYEEKGGFNVTNCAYCYDAPLPCYSGPVFNKYIKNLNYNIKPLDPENLKNGFIMYQKEVEMR